MTVPPSAQQALIDAARQDSRRLLQLAAGEIEKVNGNVAGTLSEASNRFRRWQREDPFPNTPAGLLASPDFCSYITTTGMLWPIQFDLEGVKLASLDIPLLGKAVWWDEKGIKHEQQILPKATFVLRHNSIAFVTLGPYLQIPDYLALRFNLRITHIYRGLLLGTGPLVDPGYQGQLSIPLHNLTENDYPLVGGEGLISVEFTKLSLRHSWFQDSRGRIVGDSAEPKLPPLPTALYRPFDEPVFAWPAETERSVDSNLAKAERLRPIRSSLMPIEEMVNDSIKRFKKRLKILQYAGLTSIVALLVTFAALVSQAFRDTRSTVAREQTLVDEAIRLRRADSLFHSRLDSTINAVSDSVQSLRQRSSPRR
jgi:hypothetical protein